MGGNSGTSLGRPTGLGAASNLQYTLNGITVDPNTGSLVLVGNWAGADVHFGDHVLTLGGASNVFVAHLTSDGTVAWARSYSGEWVCGGVRMHACVFACMYVCMRLCVRLHACVHMSDDVLEIWTAGTCCSAVPPPAPSQSFK